MKNLFILLCCFHVLLILQVKGQNVSCEAIENLEFWFYERIGEHKTCYMDSTTIISSTEISILAARDETMGAVQFTENDKIRFLPKNPAASFPKLIVFDASFCEIKSIFYSNFKNLGMLQYMDLQNNKIRKIRSNTFKDLRSLTTLWLHGNKIKHLNGVAFSKLTKLTAVNLNKNDCISDNFINRSEVSSMSKTIDEKCGFNEPEATGNSNELHRKVLEITMTTLNDSKVNDTLAAQEAN